MINLDQTYKIKTLDLKSRTRVTKVVKVIDILDGPGSDRRDYCTISGMQDWDVDMPVVDFLKLVKSSGE